MQTKVSLLPSGNSNQSRQVVRSSVDVGDIARRQRQLLGLKQEDVSGLANTGNRFIVDLEKGKPTLQIQMALEVLDLLGLEVVVQTKSGGSL
ncbi:MAG TPA: transcriptional regulator [Burkholderiaceae bacterium]|nr:transcriptional regulator [bacterium]HPW07341.1 transcriptional regulator [Burkholderiaceae bacterium]